MNRKGIFRISTLLAWAALVAGCEDVLWVHELHVEASLKEYPQCARAALKDAPVENVNDFLGSHDIVDFLIPVGGGHRPVAGQIQSDSGSGLKLSAVSKGFSEPDDVRTTLTPILQKIATGLLAECGRPE